MKRLHHYLRLNLAILLTLLLAVPFSEAASGDAKDGQNQQTSGIASQTAPQQPATASGLSEPTSTTTSPAQSSEDQTSSSSQASLEPDAPQAAVPQQNTTEPVGTAAAPYEKPLGVAVSRPAGAAIAPAKQKRSRSLLIRVGLVVGAAVAIGAVVALSKASPSEPSTR